MVKFYKIRNTYNQFAKHEIGKVGEFLRMAPDGQHMVILLDGSREYWALPSNVDEIKMA